jgi:RNA polymerase sigma-70 factor (ECF subfamily)
LLRSATQYDERELVEGLRAQDPAASAEFFVRAHHAVYAYAGRLTQDPDLRRDWTHDALLRLVSDVADGRFEYRGPGSFWGWFRVRAPYLLLDSLRARRRLEAREDQGRTDEGDAPDPTGPDDPCLDLERLEILLAIRSCLHSLAHANQRRALDLLLYDDLTYEQIAEILGRPLNTIRTDIRRGRLALRECLVRRLELDR